jgi:hypothetical protein
MSSEVCACDNPTCPRNGIYEPWQECPRPRCGGRMRPLTDGNDEETDQSGQNGLATA